MRIVFDISPAIERLVNRWCDDDDFYLAKIVRELKKLRQSILGLCQKSKVEFSQVRVGGIVVKGDIREMKIEFGQTLDVTATPVGGVGIQPGSAQWSVQAQDSDGGDRSGDFTVTPNPDNELNCKVQHSGSSESSGVITLRADGDRDTDEEAIVTGTLDFVVDEPNVTAFELSATVTPTP